MRRARRARSAPPCVAHRRMHAQADGRAAQRPRCRRPVRWCRGAEPGVGREDELHLHPLDERQRGGLDPEHRRAHAGRLHEVVERLRDAEQRALEPAAVADRRHRRRVRTARRAFARVNRSTSVDVKPTRLRGTDTSVPRAIVAVPGFTSIRYGLAASTPVTGTRTANAPCRRYAGPKVKTTVATDGDDAEHRQRSAQALALEAASEVGRPGTARPPTSPAASSSSADSPDRPARRSATPDIDRAHQGFLERRLVLLQVERHLLVGDAAAERPHEEEPAEADEDDIGRHAGDDDGCGAEAEPLEAVATASSATIGRPRRTVTLRSTTFQRQRPLRRPG